MNKTLSQKQCKVLLQTLESRFVQHAARHKGMKWSNVEKKLLWVPSTLWSLNEMERTGGEPDVIHFDAKTRQYTFCDCSPESPSDRRSLCYDQAALDSRKEHKPAGSALERAKAMWAELLWEEEYRALQKLGTFDLKTSSWIRTPDSIRERGGALFCDRRYDQVFTYHNGAESYYAARGFRCSVKV